MTFEDFIGWFVGVFIVLLVGLSIYASWELNVTCAAKGGHRTHHDRVSLCITDDGRIIE